MSLPPAAGVPQRHRSLPASRAHSPSPPQVPARREPPPALSRSHSPAAASRRVSRENLQGLEPVLRDTGHATYVSLNPNHTAEETAQAMQNLRRTANPRSISKALDQERERQEQYCRMQMELVSGLDDTDNSNIPRFKFWSQEDSNVCSDARHKELQKELTKAYPNPITEKSQDAHRLFQGTTHAS